jgi:uncharacterized membrane protein YfcA
MAGLHDPIELAVVLVIGLIAGTLGGMLGVGGSAAMIANVAVSVPAALRHRRAGALDRPTLVWMGSAAIVAVLVGVWLSNRAWFSGAVGQLWLGRLLAIFLVYVIVVNLRRLWRGRPEAESLGAELPAVRTRRVGVGSTMGVIAGLLGVGGGAIAVPLQQVVLRLPLRTAIGNSSAIICVSAAIGAIYKNATLGEHQADPWAGVILALLLIPTAWLGGGLGATLTHRLPMRQVRIAFLVLMIVAAWEMAALPWP